MANLIQVPQDYQTIQEAIDNASDYDTIRVAAGTYTGNITVNKTVQLLGAQAGVDARTRTNTQESIIAGTGARPFQVSADNVRIDGFTVQGNTAGHGISIGAVSGYWILNNIIQNNAIGLFTDPNAGTTTAQIRLNVFKDNNDPATNGGTGIFSHATNLLIDSNYFTGQRENASINLTTGSTNVIVSNNNIVNDTSIALLDSTNILIANNTLSDTQGTAIFIAGNTNITDIEGNTISGSTGNGISVNNIFSPSTNRNIRAIDNAIEANQLAGLNVDAGSYNDASPNRPLDATNNWWGSSSGPNYNGTGPGTGQLISDPSNVVIYTPFLTTNPLAPASVITPIQRLVSNSSAVYAANNRNAAVIAALTGSGRKSTTITRYDYWPKLEKFVNDNSDFGNTSNPDYVWDSSTGSGQTRGFAIASDPFTLSTASQLLIALTVFCDNAMKVQIDLADAETNRLVSTSPLRTILIDGSMNATTGLANTKPPYGWQTIRYYTIPSEPLIAGTYKLVVSFLAVNYKDVPGEPNPAGLSFVTDIYQAV